MPLERISLSLESVWVSVRRKTKLVNLTDLSSVKSLMLLNIGVLVGPNYNPLYGVYWTLCHAEMKFMSCIFSGKKYSYCWRKSNIWVIDLKGLNWFKFEYGIVIACIVLFWQQIIFLKQIFLHWYKWRSLLVHKSLTF